MAGWRGIRVAGRSLPHNEVFFVILFNSSGKFLLLYLKYVHDAFLAHPFQFVTHYH